MFQKIQDFCVNFTFSAVSHFSVNIVSSEVQKRLIQARSQNIFTWMFVCCCNLMMLYDWRECVMSTWHHRNILSAIVLTLGNEVVLEA